MASEHDDLTDDERRALIDLVHWEIEHSRFPLSERIRMLKRIRLKLRKQRPRRDENQTNPSDDVCVVA
jgi:hypothetical protein